MSENSNALQTEPQENECLPLKSMEKKLKFEKQTKTSLHKRDRVVKVQWGWGWGWGAQFNALKKRVNRKNNTMYKKTFLFTQTAKHS